MFPEGFWPSGFWPTNFFSIELAAGGGAVLCEVELLPSRWLYIGSDHSLTLRSVRNKDGEFLNEGDCAWVLKNVDLETIATGVFEYVEGSDGEYETVVDSAVTLGLEEGILYFMDISFEQDDYQKFVRLRKNAMYDEGRD